MFRSIDRCTPPRALYAPGLLKHFHDLRCIAQAVISFQRIIQKVTPLIICTRYPGDLCLSPRLPTGTPPTPDFTRCCVEFDRRKRFIRVALATLLLNLVSRKHRSARVRSRAREYLNSHVDFFSLSQVRKILLSRIGHGCKVSCAFFKLD